MLFGSTASPGQYFSKSPKTEVSRPVMANGVSIWHIPAKIQGSREWVLKKLHSIQGQDLWVAVGGYSATPIEVVNVKTKILPIDLRMKIWCLGPSLGSMPESLTIQ